MGNFIPIPYEDLPSMIGKTIHLSWAAKGARWNLDSIEGTKIHLHARRSKAKLIANASDACYTRRNEPVEVGSKGE